MVNEYQQDDLSRAREQKIHKLRRQEEEHLAQTIASQGGLPYKDLTLTPVDGTALTILSKEEAENAGAVIISRKDSVLTVAVKNPSSFEVKNLLEKLRKESWRPSVVVVSPFSFEHAVSFFERFAYLKTNITGEVTVSSDLIKEFLSSITDTETLRNKINQVSPKDTSKLLELILAGAMKVDASDIHIEPRDAEAIIRLRIDGILYDLFGILPAAYHFLLERIKLLSGLKLNITDKGQDGRFSINAADNEVEIRTSTLPGERGEYVVMRLLNPTKLVSINKLGLRKDLLLVLNKELKRPNGMILTSGPTGSGKTTALAAFVKSISSEQIKIITIEDPIEYHLTGVEQTQVAPEDGYDFANGLRSIVRQDPDVILVGEIRDKETAEIAVQAALTGHLVFSTLHSNDAAGAIPRLVELGVNPENIAPALNLTMAQRLIRKICKTCASAEKISSQELKSVKVALANVPKGLVTVEINEHLKIFKAKGCKDCNGTGYKGRVGIFELFLLDETMKAFIAKNPGVYDIHLKAQERGMVPMQQDGILKILDGVTTLEEIERITGPIG